MNRLLLAIALLAFPAHAGENAVNCAARRERCRTLDRLCRNGSGTACIAAAKCWTDAHTGCGK